jgi:hypothetical protein
MAWLTANYGYWEFWAPSDPSNGFYGEQKCIFDGENKMIYINPNVSQISIKQDVYSNWKEWVQVRDNSKFAPAIRTTGGDPVGGGAFTGDVYFLINGWRMYLDHAVDVVGVLYSDNFPSPFVTGETSNIVRSNVSNLVQTVESASPQDLSLIPKAVWDYLLADSSQVSGSVAQRMNNLLTVAKYLGLK